MELLGGNIGESLEHM